MIDFEGPCPCSSGCLYKACCRRFHMGDLTQNAQELMQSRYSAYALNLADYIIDTTHPASPQYSGNKYTWKRSISQFSRSSNFHKLKILDFKENKRVATVVFTAYIFQNDLDVTYTEKSYFEKLNNKWLYRSGQLAEGHAPNFVTTSQLRLLPLAYYGDSILRRRADPIVEITDDIKKLVEEMIETMDASDGVGIAAPQVHHSIRLFVIKAPIELESNKFQSGEAQAYLNPKLSMPSKEIWEAPEGCLSIPTIRAPVKRPKEITIEYTDLHGNIIKKRISGWEARVIMHENDHINGVLFVDRLNAEEQRKIKPLLSDLEKRIHDGMAL